MKRIVSLILAVVLAFACLALTACGAADEVKVIDIALTDEKYAFGVDKNQPELLAQVNAFIADIKTNGQLDAICEKYVQGGEPTGITSAVEDSSKDQLVVATNAQFEPFEYKLGDKYYGVDMEIAKLLADHLGKELVIKNMDFDAVCLSVSQGITSGTGERTPNEATMRSNTVTENLSLLSYSHCTMSISKPADKIGEKIWS